MEIHRSARKHGAEDDDIHHAIEHAVAVADLGDGRALHLGPDRSANLLEIVVQSRRKAPPLVIHAMRMRTKYEPYLRGLEHDND